MPREISGAICRLQAMSEASRPEDHLELAEEALGEMIRQNSRVVRLGDIEKAVCKLFGLESQCAAILGQEPPHKPAENAGHVAGGSTPVRR